MLLHLGIVFSVWFKGYLKWPGLPLRDYYYLTDEEGGQKELLAPGPIVNLVVNTFGQDCGVVLSELALVLYSFNKEVRKLQRSAAGMPDDEIENKVSAGIVLLC